jgi:hypothetical protein
MGAGYFGAIYFGQYSTGAPPEDIDARLVVAVDVSPFRTALDVSALRVAEEV